ncbi:MAG: cyclic nucleotide-binding domain-containing protein [Chthonomonadales bacterium]
METLERILAEHPFFEGLDPQHLKAIEDCATNVRFKPDEYIFREGEEANWFYLIRQGKVALEVFHLEQGSIIIQTLGPGDVLGWSWLIPPYRWRFDARALEHVRAFALDGRCLRTKCDESPELGYALLKRFAMVLEQRLQATRLQLLDLYSVRR